MQRYLDFEQVQLGDYISFDNKGKFYHGLPFEILVGEVIEKEEPDNIKVKFDIQGEDVLVDLPYFIAQ